MGEMEHVSDVGDDWLLVLGTSAKVVKGHILGMCKKLSWEAILWRAGC